MSTMNDEFENSSNKNLSKPKLLYHLIHGDIEGDKIRPFQANEQDPEPYVYATSNLIETLPYLTPNGTRIVNASIPGTNEILTIIPDRDSFLKNGNMQGTLLSFSGTRFQQKYIDGQPTTQWVSKDPVLLEDTAVVEEVKGIERAMELGLQILFTREPITADNVEQISQIYSDKSFPHNIPSLIEQGVLVHENAVRNINPSSFLLRNQGIKPELNYLSDHMSYH